ncbi:MAG: DUF2339 domain-containing protein [Marinobacter sp.]|jgi:hypothetical protein|nr:DUF2339 domain-containing protein [Marinobacter sp.]
MSVLIEYLLYRNRYIALFCFFARKNGYAVFFKAGMALLGSVIGKIFLIDMAGLESLWRVAAFYGAVPGADGTGLGVSESAVFPDKDCLVPALEDIPHPTVMSIEALRIHPFKLAHTLSKTDRKARTKHKTPSLR